jgi:hypothetical protein
MTRNDETNLDIKLSSKLTKIRSTLQWIKVFSQIVLVDHLPEWMKRFLKIKIENQIKIDSKKLKIIFRYLDLSLTEYGAKCWRWVVLSTCNFVNYSKRRLDSH